MKSQNIFLLEPNDVCVRERERERGDIFMVNGYLTLCRYAGTAEVVIGLQKVE